MKQFEIDKNTITFYVKKSPLFVRATLFVLAFLFFIMPVFGMIANAIINEEVQIMFFAAIFLFSLMGFYLLRLALWNTYGREAILITDAEISYFPDYGWFKGNITSVKNDGVLLYIEQIGYEEDKTGRLCIITEEKSITCAVKLPLEQLDDLIVELKQSKLFKQFEITKSTDE